MALCAYYKIRGCVYALLFLGLAAVVKHGFFTSNHFWQFCLEGSLASGFLITALTLDQRKSMVDALQEISKTRESTISHLEEDLSKLKSSTDAQQISLQERLSLKQSELDELQAELSSILMLNGVLRKTTAERTVEAEHLGENVLDKDRRICALLAEIDDLQKELARVSNLSGMTEENRNLQKELNTVRVDKAQTLLINETLVRLHAKEVQKVTEISDKFHVLHADRQKALEDLGSAKAEIQMLSTHLQQTTEELERALTSLKQTEKVQIEKNFLQERLHSAEAELAAVVPKAEILEKAPSDLQAVRQEFLRTLDQKEETEEKLKANAQIESLYNQLRKQFEEKNVILHETRAKLFQTETELQKLLIEKEQHQPDLLSTDLAQEMTELTREISDLQFENDQLQQIITSLNQNPAQ